MQTAERNRRQPNLAPVAPVAYTAVAVGVYSVGVRLATPAEAPFSMPDLALPLTVAVLAAMLWHGLLARRGGLFGAAAVPAVVGALGVLALRPSADTVALVVPLEMVLWIAAGLAGGLASEALGPRRQARGG